MQKEIDSTLLVSIKKKNFSAFKSPILKGTPKNLIVYFFLIRLTLVLFLYIGRNSVLSDGGVVSEIVSLMTSGGWLSLLAAFIFSMFLFFFASVLLFSTTMAWPPAVVSVWCDKITKFPFPLIIFVCVCE